jgi:cytochrome c5
MNLIRIALALGLVMSAAGNTALADHNTEDALNKRVAAVGSLNIMTTEEAATAAEEAASQVTEVAAAGPADGEAVYNSACAACHAAGVAGAPKLGDPEVWSGRITQGMDVLLDHAINGYQGEKGVMPAKGGNAALSDEEVTAAVEHMVNASQ